MRILHSYILRLHLVPFLLGFGVVTFVLVMDVLFDYLDLVLNRGVPVGVVLQLFLLSLGYIVALSVPCAVLVAVLMTFGRLSQDHETIALRASGVNMGRVLTGPLLAAAMLTGVLIYFNDRILPETNHAFANLLIDIGRMRPTVKLQEGVFITDFPGYDMLVQSVNGRTNEMKGITIYQLNPGGYPTTILARSGFLSYTRDGRTAVLELRDGEIHDIPADEGDTHKYRRLLFKTHVIYITGAGAVPYGVDVVEPPMLFALQKEGIDVRDGQQVMLQAREVKNIDELTLLNMAAAMVDGVYQDIFEALKPGVRESDIVALAHARLFEMGSEFVEAINSIAGERCSPHPHVFTDRLIRPGDQAYFDIIQSFMGYRTCYYRTFAVGKASAAQIDAYKKARDWMDSAIEMLKPGVSTDKVARMFPKSTEIGFETEMSAFGLNFCHGLGLGLHERPLISRLNSFKDPYELKAGMVFAVETFCPAKDGISAARIEEEVVLTPDGAKVITLFPAQELPIANKY